MPVTEAEKEIAKNNFSNNILWTLLNCSVFPILSNNYASIIHYQKCSHLEISYSIKDLHDKRILLHLFGFPRLPSIQNFNYFYRPFKCLRQNFNPLKPNDHYSGRTAPLTSKRCILYIYSKNTGAKYFKHGIYPRFFSSKCSLFHNSNVFGSSLVQILYTGCAKI